MKRINVKFDLLGAIVDREPFAYHAQEPTKGTGPLPTAPPAFRKEIAAKTAAAKEARSAIPKPSSKLSREEREYMHTFAFSAEVVLAGIRPSKKHDGRQA
jgi:hypothetical protein